MLHSMYVFEIHIMILFVICLAVNNRIEHVDNVHMLDTLKEETTVSASIFSYSPE